MSGGYYYYRCRHWHCDGTLPCPLVISARDLKAETETMGATSDPPKQVGTGLAGTWPEAGTAQSDLALEATGVGYGQSVT